MPPAQLPVPLTCTVKVVVAGPWSGVTETLVTSPAMAAFVPNDSESAASKADARTPF